MDRRQYQAAQYIFILVFLGFFIYVVSRRCDSTLTGTIFCWPKVLGVSAWFVSALVLLKISYARLKRGSDAKEAFVFWFINALIMALHIALFVFMFVWNYI
ncbi:MAG: hypothetical protein QS98_C0001G0056 [archaeon GW2011_AR3]|nr:MAG: hypothetical protein QS98_C0001G0056 [archaeon GW2011_AR3]MBS3109334.1 hypothetical protein [Candidatus Woesearchaeota archaeon]